MPSIPSESGKIASVSGLAGRRFALLQGPSSFFFAHFGEALKARGAEVLRVGFCPGDRLFWRRRAGRYLPYRDTMAAFPSWLAGMIEHESVTDLVMLGDGREPHSAAIEVARAGAGEVRIWIVEHGYLRPDLILIEPDGMGGGSKIPDRPVPYPCEEAEVPTGTWSSSFARYATMDVAYHLCNVFGASVTYPHYRPHSGIHPLKEYGGWVRKFATGRSRAAAREVARTEIAATDGQLFLFPLQLSHDMQLVKYGTGESQTETLERVIQSFVAHAPQDAHLIVKVHPLDNALTNWARLVARHRPRVIYLDGGDLDALFRRLAGVVTTNSTVGLSALIAGVPTLALGQAIYRKAGLSSTQQLDAFWSAPETPDMARVSEFQRLLLTEHHVAGAFDGPGAVAGAAALANWLARGGAKRAREAA